MKTNVRIDDHLIAEAQRLGRHKTKKSAVMAALTDYVRIKTEKRFGILELEGKVDFSDDFDPKQLRRRKPGRGGRAKK